MPSSRKGTKDVRYSLLPHEALDDVAKVMAAGTKKYPEHGWRDGYPYSYYFDATNRHLSAWLQGQDTDDETGLPTLAHAAASLLILLAMTKHHPEHDDRPRHKTTVEAKVTITYPDSTNFDSAYKRLRDALEDDER